MTLINVGARKAGLAEGSEPDLPQVKKAIDGARALLPLLEAEHAEHLGPVRDALSRLQMAYVQKTGGETAPGEAPQEPGETGSGGAEGGPGPAQSSGRLWVPGQ